MGNACCLFCDGLSSGSHCSSLPAEPLLLLSVHEKANCPLAAWDSGCALAILSFICHHPGICRDGALNRVRQPWLLCLLAAHEVDLLVGGREGGQHTSSLPCVCLQLQQVS